MSQLQIDFGLAQKLRSLNEPVELCDPEGKVIGKYVPAFNLADWEFETPDITDEEMQRRLASTGKRYTTAEVIAYLESL